VADSSWGPWDGVDLGWWKDRATAGTVGAVFGNTAQATYENAELNEELGIGPEIDENGCDRTGFFGKIGGCDALAAAKGGFSGLADVLDSPILTYGAIAAAIAAGTFGTVVILNSTGATPVLQATGAAFAKGISRGARAAFGGR
jgi:hypothetical protein